jgi:hypothetical protein
MHTKQECPTCGLNDRIDELEREVNALTDEVNFSRGFMYTLSERIDKLGLEMPEA